MNITTERTTLSFIGKKDFADILNLYHEEDTFRYIPHLEGWAEEKYLDLLEKKIVENTTDIGYYWIARSRKDKSLIGAMNVNKMRNFDKMQIGFQISRKYWNQGYGSELCEAVTNHMVLAKSYTELYAIYDIANTGSGKILEKCDYVLDEIVMEDNTQLNRVKYSVNG